MVAAVLVSVGWERLRRWQPTIYTGYACLWHKWTRAPQTRTKLLDQKAGIWAGPDGPQFLEGKSCLGYRDPVSKITCQEIAQWVRAFCTKEDLSWDPQHQKKARFSGESVTPGRPRLMGRGGDGDKPVPGAHYPDNLPKPMVPGSVRGPVFCLQKTMWWAIEDIRCDLWPPHAHA